MDWFILLHKKICEWEWYTDIPTKTLFLHILLKCNYKEAKWRWIDVKPWDFITSLEHLSQETWLTVRQVRTALEHLEKTWEVTKQSTSLYTILTLNNWNTYNIRDDKPTTNEWQTNDKPTTTTNKDNTEYKEKKENKTETDTNVSSQAIVPLDNRNKWTQRIIDIVKSQVELEGFLYDNNKEERNRATIIAKRQSDWWTFIKEESEEKEEYIIRSIISYSNQNEYTSKIRSAKDFHEKWKRVANTMKEAWKEAEKNIPNPNPLLRFTR